MNQSKLAKYKGCSVHTDTKNTRIHLAKYTEEATDKHNMYNLLGYRVTIKI